MNYLIVDDEVVSVNGIRKGVHWEEVDCENVYTAISAAEAREILTKKEIDILLCDVDMPNEDGISLVSWIRETSKPCECIFLSCHDEFQYVKRALQLSSVDYVLKPIPYDELELILKKTVEKIREKRKDERYRTYAKSRLQKEQEELAEEVDGAEKIVQNVISYINANLSEEFTISMLAGMNFVSESYLSRIFKKSTGNSIVEYITNQRMFVAAELLRNPRVSIGKAAISTGYDNYAYFAKIFKRIYGMTPTQYQQKFGEKPCKADK